MDSQNYDIHSSPHQPDDLKNEKQEQKEAPKEGDKLIYKVAHDKPMGPPPSVPPRPGEEKHDYNKMKLPESENVKEGKEKGVDELLNRPFNTLTDAEKDRRCNYKFQNRMQMTKEEIEFGKKDRSKKEGVFHKFIKGVKGAVSFKNPSSMQFSEPEMDFAPKITENKPKEKERVEDFQPAPSKLAGTSENGLILSGEAIKFEKATPEELKQLQKHIQNVNKTYPSLKIDKLAPELQPVNKLKVGNATYYCSAPLELMGDHKPGHVVVIALVVINGKVYPRMLYESMSQASWRVAPAIDKQEDLFGYINKGGGEHTTQLPLALNGALHALHQQVKATNQPLRELKTEESHSLVQTRNMYGIGKLDYTFTKHLKHGEKIASEEVAGRDNYPDPKSLKIMDPQLLPDFKDESATFKFQSPVYGTLTAHVYPSKNKAAQYLFYEDQKGKVFLSTIETLKTGNDENPINKYGVRQTQSDLKGIDSPFWEYRQNMAAKHLEIQYWPKDDIIKDPTGKYTSFWNYVREIPLIQSYYESQGRQIPPKD